LDTALQEKDRFPTGAIAFLKSAGDALQDEHPQSRQHGQGRRKRDGSPSAPRLVTLITD